MWRNAVMIPIHKKTNSSNTLRDYRPIPLLSTLSRTFERIIGKRLGYTIEPLLISRQHGFRPGRGTTSLLLELENRLKLARRARRDAYVLSMDLEKAFDRVCKHVILKQLLIWGIDLKFIQVIQSFLSRRSYQVRVNGFYTDKHFLDNGIPQGSPISTHLFNIYVHKLSLILTGLEDVDHYMYADNIIIATSSEDPERSLRRAIVEAEVWADDVGAHIPVSKTELLSVPSHRRPRMIAVEQRGATVVQMPRLKLLGMHITKNLKWNLHIKEMKIKLNGVHNLVKAIAAKKRGASTPVTLHVAKILINGITNYGLTIYGTAPDTQQRLIQTTINSILRTAIGAYITTPIEALLTETGQKVFADRLKIAQAKLVAKNIFNPAKPHHWTLAALTDGPPDMHASALETALVVTRRLGTPIPHPTQTPQFPLHHHLPHPNFRRQILEHLPKSSTPELVYRKLHQNHLNNTRARYVVYTDGSKTEQRVTSAAVTTRMADGETIDKSVWKLHPNTTVFEAELYAIYRAVEMARDRQGSTLIFTDSRAAIESLSQQTPEDWLSQRTRQAILNNKDSIQISWVPGHAGIPGNEAADRLSKAQTSPQDEEIIPPCESFIQRTSITEVNRERKERWESQTTFLSHHWKNIKPPTYDPHLTRKQGQTITRLRLGHTRLTHEYLITKTPRPGCIHCQQPLTVEHLLKDCNVTRRTYGHALPDLTELLNPEKPQMLLRLIDQLELLHKI